MIRDTGATMEKLKIRKDRTPAVLRKLAKAETDARVARRLLAIANALSGMSRAEAAKSAGMDRQTLRDWVIRYNEHGVAGLCDRRNSGRPPMLTLDEQAELLAIVMAGPDPGEGRLLRLHARRSRGDRQEEVRQVDASGVDGAPAAEGSACRGRRRGPHTR